MKQIEKSSNIIFIATIAVLLIAVSGCTSTDQTKNSNLLHGKGKYSVEAKEVDYFGNPGGFLAMPTEPGNYPGVIMIHDWWGLNENIKDMAKVLASEGYSVLAVDLFNGKVATDPERAQQLVSSLDSEKAIENMRDAYAYLMIQQNASKIGSIGWGFGGGQSLQLALSGEYIDATVIYYGDPVTNESRLSIINWPVLGVFGDNDTIVPVSTVQEFNSTLNKIGIEHEIYVYKGARHEFADPSGTTYALNETEDAWEKTIEFFSRYLKETD